MTMRNGDCVCSAAVSNVDKDLRRAVVGGGFLEDARVPT